MKQYDGISLIGNEALEIIEQSVEMTKHLHYDMAEFGVFKGGSAKVICRTDDSKRLLHLFDTFSCQPFDDEIFYGFKAGDFQTNLDQVKNYLKDCLVEYHVGVFQEIKLPDIQYSFVHIDSDLYQNITFAIDYFYPRVVIGGIIIFDDFDNINCSGVRKALEEKGLIDKIIPTLNYTQCKIIKE